MHTFQRLRFIAGIVLFLLTSCASFGQALIDVRPVQSDELQAPVLGQYVTAGQLPAPEWHAENGLQVARLTLKGTDAAAWLVNFRSVQLPEGAQMFIYGLEAGGQIRSQHGPFLGNGPLNVPEFSTEVVAGAALMLEVRAASATQEWPFQIDSMEAISADRLAELQASGLSVSVRVRPAVGRVDANPDVRSTWVGDRLVLYEVVNGRAIMEGDIDLGPASEIVPASSSKSGNNQAHVTTVVSQYWPGGVVPFRTRYSGTTAISQGSQLDLAVQAAAAYWNSIFPGILKARTNETDFVTVEFLLNNCQSNSIGRNGGEQLIQVDTSCSKGNLIHEFGHVLGLYHEHARPDRNNFVQILFNNIQGGKSSQFQIPSNSAGSGAYDFGSVMHYPLNAFSSNGLNTIQPIVSVPTGTIIGQRSGLSTGDQAAIRGIYCSSFGFKASNFGNWVVPSEATGGSFGFYAPPYCSWKVSTSASWIHIKSVTSGTGSASISFNVDAYNSQYQRTGSIAIGPIGAVVTQQGTAYCTNTHIYGCDTLP